MDRRSFLGGFGATLTSSALWPRLARAAAAGDRKLVFVFAQGGWDPTRVFADGFDHAGVDMEPLAERGSVGDLRFVDHPDRPSVRGFFEAHAARTVVFDGVMVRSIAHDICTMIAMTGDTSGTVPDWAAIVAAAEAERYTLPHLVLGGPSFPGSLGVAVARTGSAGQLEALLSGESLALADLPVGGPNAPARSLLDRYLARRAAARAGAARSALDARLAGDYATALAQATALEDLRWTMDFTGGATLEDQAMVAVEALSLGVARCVTLGTGAAFGWDTHANNDALQSPLWDDTFAGLARLLAMLEATPGTTSASLAEETLVVVLSEMGRTPALNAFQGKDHWPYTSLMVVGPGVDGGRVVGGWDESWYGQPVDPVTGDVDPDGQVLSAEAVGATLLALADVDPDAHVRGVAPITGVMA
jgi:uncharacterized protein (DUF1501 family)